VFAVPLRAADTLNVYDLDTLERANQLYAKSLRPIWNEDLLAKLTVIEREAAGNVRLDLPLRGYQGNPFDYHSDPRTRVVTIPIQSVKFFDDLAIAQAWLTAHKCAWDPVSDYVGVMRYQGSSLSPGNRVPPPLEALGIPQNALEDALVDDVSQKTLKSAIYFLMVHEIAHIVYQHKPYNAITAQEAQAQEIQADEFALHVMRRISVPPIGMVLFFAVSSRAEPAPGDFPSMEAYETSVRQRSTHPLTSQRLLALSKGIRSNADAFSQGQNNPTLWRPRIVQAADQIEAIGNTLDDRKMREYQKYRSETIKVSDLRNSCLAK
jgi:hypothetical protein